MKPKKHIAMKGSYDFFETIALYTNSIANYYLFDVKIYK